MNQPFIPTSDMARPVASHGRWASFGPYYAMFPVEFARNVITAHTRPGDGVFDPFAGRGTSIFCAAELGRAGLGVELNPLGWIYGKVKLNPGRKELVLARLTNIGARAAAYREVADTLPEFYVKCFCPGVRSFLLAARCELDWRRSSIDRTLMGFILVYLHGKIDEGKPAALSNQMRQTKALAPEYSIKWWDENGFGEPPSLDPVPFLRQRIEWRYQRGRISASVHDADIRLGDCRKIVPRLRGPSIRQNSLLLTSPPYCGVTSYYYDQWLRFWMLGEAEHPTRDAIWKSKFENLTEYRKLLDTAFKAARRVMADDATVYVRTDARNLTRDATISALERAFPEWAMQIEDAPFPRDTQTALFGDKAKKPGEVDIILTR